MTSRKCLLLSPFLRLIGGRRGLFLYSPHWSKTQSDVSWRRETNFWQQQIKIKSAPSSSDRMWHPPHPPHSNPSFTTTPSTTSSSPRSSTAYVVWCYCCPELKSEPEEGNEAPTDTLSFLSPPLWVPGAVEDDTKWYKGGEGGGGGEEGGGELGKWLLLGVVRCLQPGPSSSSSSSSSSNSREGSVLLRGFWSLSLLSRPKRRRDGGGLGRG